MLEYNEKIKQIACSVFNNKPCWINVISNSMSPIIKSGESVFVTVPCNFTDYKRGDIVLTKDFLVHRLIYISKTYAITKGDKSLKVDNPITPDKLIGKVKLIGKQIDSSMLINYNLEDCGIHILNKLLGYWFYLKNYKHVKQNRNGTPNCLAS